MLNDLSRRDSSVKPEVNAPGKRHQAPEGRRSVLVKIVARLATPPPRHSQESDQQEEDAAWLRRGGSGRCGSFPEVRGQRKEVGEGNTARAVDVTFRVLGCGGSKIRGADGLARALQDLVTKRVTGSRFEFKVFGITTKDGSIVTDQFFSMYGSNGSLGREVHAVWRCRWSRTAPDAKPLLHSIELEDYEETITRSRLGKLFNDCTEAVFGDNASYHGQLVCLYLGPLEVGQLLSDVELLQASLLRRRELESALTGRWFADPRHVPLTGLVSAFRDAGFDEDANWYRQRAAPQLALGYCGIALDAERRGDMQTALSLYEKALELDPGSARTHNYYGEHLMRRRAVDEAMANFRKAIELDPKLAEAHHNLATVCVLKREFRQAVESYREALRLDPQLAKSHTALGRLFQQVGRHVEAAGHFEAALAADPNLASAHVYLGMTRLHQKRPADAGRHLTEAIRIAPDQSDAHEALGRVLAAQAKTTEAIRHWREAVRLNPQSLQASLKLAWYLSTDPDPQNRAGDEALPLARRVTEATDMRSPQALDVLAAAYAEVGQFQQAVKMSEAAAHLAESGSDAELARQIGQRRALYERRQPFRRQVTNRNETKSDR